MLTVIYTVLGVVEVKLMLTYIRKGAEEIEPPIRRTDPGADRPLAFAY